MIEVGDPRAALFASDMHLDDDAPELTSFFLDQLARRLSEDVQTRGQGPGVEAPTLFLLGDLFEFWIGDDGAGDAGDRLASALSDHARRGLRIVLMHGNRDFLIDTPLPTARTPAAAYSRRCRATLLADPSIIRIGGQPVLLAHGDAWCTADQRYQQWRALCRSPAWQQQTLARPLAERRALALSIRQASRQSQQGRVDLDSAGDVDPDSIDAAMSSAGVERVIHGHTHRPALHVWTVAGRQRRRWVLTDWDTHASPPRGAILSAAEGFQLPPSGRS